MKGKLTYLLTVLMAVTGCAVVNRKKPTPPPPPMPSLSTKAALREATLPKSAPVAVSHIQMASLVPASSGDGTFLIITQTPVRIVIIAGITSITAGVCVLTPSNANYQVQVATNANGPWRDRLQFTANNGQTSCWHVPLQASETNRFFFRCRLAPPNGAAIDSKSIRVIRPMAWAPDLKPVSYVTGYVDSLLPATAMRR